jgi:hypothetical protein
LKYDDSEDTVAPHNDAAFPKTKAEGDLNKRQKHFDEQ